MTVISYVKCLQRLRATVIKISSFFILLKKMRSAHRMHPAVYLSPICVIIMCVT